MTPLAQNLARQLLKVKSERDSFWGANRRTLADSFDDTHFFETTEIIPLLGELKNLSQEYVDTLVFLPAPKTWIEWNHPFGRIAILLESFGDMARSTAFWKDCSAALGSISLTSDDYKCCGTLGLVPQVWKDAYGESMFAGLLAAAHLQLVIINSPKIIGRKQHMPHRGLERDLLRSKTLSGKYPLHAWHELKLEARPTYFDKDGFEHEAHLTGKKCLHFCRSHLRIRNGKLELVNAHWRGDPALGIKRTRYRVTA